MSGLCWLAASLLVEFRGGGNPYPSLARCVRGGSMISSGPR